ncbi:MAG TPA: hypothetical protein VIL69_04000 [Roseomonas sp.]|jgi:hypothetical protein
MATTSRRPEGNPFPVYPVLPLADVADIREATVHTPETAQVEGLVREYAACFSKSSEKPAKLLLAVEGDFGAGKTHLLRFAAGVLRHECLSRNDAVSPRPTKPWFVFAPASEAPVEAWYSQDLGPALVDGCRPRELVRQLLTDIACQVAEEAEDTRDLAEEFRQNRRALYERFREPGLFDVSEVDERFDHEIRRLSGRTAPYLQSVLSALRWEETADLAEDWLAGQDLEAAQLSRLRVRAGLDPAMRASQGLLALAALSRRQNQPFVLLIDEFEHLTRHDLRHRSRRNTTWLKRLVEGLALRGAMVCVSGHWDAWKQKGDFLDRFLGNSAINLLRLDEDDVLKIVAVYAQHWSSFGRIEAGWVVAAADGNIRRVMTLLHDLYGESDGGILAPSRGQVVTAARRRLHPTAEPRPLQLLTEAARAQGASVTQTGPDVTDDLVIALGDKVIRVQAKYARDPVALVNRADEAARRYSGRDDPGQSAILLLSGAVDDRYLKAWRVRYPRVQFVNAESPALKRELEAAVSAALTAERSTREPSTPGDVETPSEVRGRVLREAEEVRSRAVVTLGEGARSGAVSEAVLPDQEDVAEARERQARHDVIATAVQQLRALANQWTIKVGLIQVLPTSLFGGAAAWAAYWKLVVANEPSYPSFTPTESFLFVFAAVAVILVLALYYMRLRVSDFVRFCTSVYRRLEYLDAPSSRILEAQSILERAMATETLPNARRVAERDLVAAEVLPPLPGWGTIQVYSSAVGPSPAPPPSSPSPPRDDMRK